MGINHGMACLRTKGLKLAAIAEKDKARLEQFYRQTEKEISPEAARTVRALPVFGDYKDMIVHADIGAVLNALPTPLHASSSLFALRRGKHVLCEKPPTTTVAEMSRVARAARAQKLTFMFVRQKRYAKINQTARRLVLQGKLGEVYHADAKWIRSCGIPFRGGWGVNKKAGGGALLDLGFHKLDDAWYLMGCPRPVTAFAVSHCAFADLGRGKGLAMPYDADDFTIGTVCFANGASICITVSFALNTAGPTHKFLEAKGKTEWQELTLFGTKGGLDVENRKWAVRKGDDVLPLPLNIPKGLKGPHPFLAMYLDFARAIQTGFDSQNTPEQGVMLMQMLEGLKSSAENGRVATIRPLGEEKRK
jgi:predicted dehydrogenase